MLEAANISRAIAHLNAVGDSDLFPKLPEIRFLAAAQDEVVGTIERLGVGNYNPTSSIEVLTPKSELGFRIGHQLTATDSLIYTASVIEAGAGIERLRQEHSGPVPFSYRFDPEGGARLFHQNRGYHDWLVHLTTLGGDEPFQDTRPVLETDIADFYQRIYFHRIENILDDARASRHSAGAIKKIIQVCRSKQSFGIPVGSSASRLLAEGLLCDTDRLLLDMGLDASRYVDDYRIIATDQHNTHTVLCRLAEHLMVTEGLSLNASKTRVTDTERLHRSAETRLEDVFSSAEMQALREYLDDVYGEEEVEGEDADEREIVNDDDDEVPTTENPFLTSSELLDRLDELKRRGGSDFSSRKAILKVLQRYAEFDVSRFLKDHSDLAYHLPRDFCRVIRGNMDSDPVELDHAIWGLLQTPPISELSHARLWLLNLYASGVIPADRKLLQLRNISVLEERQLIAVRYRLNDRPFFRDQRGRLGQAGDWLKPVLLMGASCLPADEYRHWLDIAARQMADPLAPAFANWLKSGPNVGEAFGIV